MDAFYKKNKGIKVNQSFSGIWKVSWWIVDKMVW